MAPKSSINWMVLGSTDVTPISSQSMASGGSTLPCTKHPQKSSPAEAGLDLSVPPVSGRDTISGGNSHSTDRDRTQLEGSASCRGSVQGGKRPVLGATGLSWRRQRPVGYPIGRKQSFYRSRQDSAGGLSILSGCCFGRKAPFSRRDRTQLEVSASCRVPYRAETVILPIATGLS